MTLSPVCMSADIAGGLQLLPFDANEAGGGISDLSTDRIERANKVGDEFGLGEIVDLEWSCLPVPYGPCTSRPPDPR